MLSATDCLVRPILLACLSLLLSMPAGAKESFFVVEAHSGRILLAEDALEQKPVASLTKIATAMVTLDWADATKTDLGSFVTVPPSAATIGGSNPMGLRAGDRISLRNALYSALLGSDNAAAETIASGVGAGILAARGRQGDPVSTFIREMNVLARALGMKDTRFVNAHGMDNGKQRGHSTATDIARLCIYAMRDPGFAFFVKQKSRKISFQQAGRTLGFQVENTNKLLGKDDINGIKTGMTARAGQCLATSSEKKALVKKLPDGRSILTPRRLICVVLDSPDRFARTTALVPQGWAAYEKWRNEGAVIADPAREALIVPNPQ